MRRLTALIKKIVPISAEAQAAFTETIKKIDLLPGEWIPDDLPPGTTIFVEEGFVLLTRYSDNQWKCVNFYPEGTAAVTYSEGAAEHLEDSYRVKATEPTRIYYLTREDGDRLREIAPEYNIALARLRRRSFMKNEERKQIFRCSNSFDRIVFVSTFFPVLLRAPLEDLAVFLQLEHEFDRPILEGFQSKRVASMRSLSQNN